MRVKKTRSMSRRIAAGILLIDGAAVGVVLYLCRLSILLGFTGSLPYLTALIGALQAATAAVLTAYFSKSKAENTQGGIVYDTAVRPGYDC